MIECQGTRQVGQAMNYNARGRKMHLVTCPVCGAEFKRQGKTSGTAGVPAHEVQEPA